MTERQEKGWTCLKEKQPAGQIDFAEGSVRRKTLALAAPMLIAQVLNLLYNIVDRIYIGKIPGEGTAALAGLGLCFPVVTIVTAFANLFGAGGAPLCSIARGKGNRESAQSIMRNAYFMLLVSGAEALPEAVLSSRISARAIAETARCAQSAASSCSAAITSRTPAASPSRFAVTTLASASVIGFCPRISLSAPAVS